MLNNKFHLVLDNEGYGHSDTDEILAIAKYAPQNFSVPPYKIQYIKGLIKNPNIHLLCDYPMSINTFDAKIGLCENYLKKFRGTIRGVDFAPMQAACLDENWGYVTEDIQNMAGFCLRNRINSRMIINLRCYKDDDQINKIINIAEQHKVGEVIIGDDIDMIEDFGDFMIDIHNIVKNHSITSGVLVNCDSLEKAKILNESPYPTILISFENILDLFDNGV